MNFRANSSTCLNHFIVSRLPIFFRLRIVLSLAKSSGLGSVQLGFSWHFGIDVSCFGSALSDCYNQCKCYNTMGINATKTIFPCPVSFKHVSLKGLLTWVSLSAYKHHGDLCILAQSILGTTAPSMEAK